MNKEDIRDIARANGFQLKKQPDGSMDLHPYVYGFASVLLRYSINNAPTPPSELVKTARAVIDGFDKAGEVSIPYGFLRNIEDLRAELAKTK
jgi:hypothetical protein